MKDLYRRLRKLVLLPIRKTQFGFFGYRADFMKPMMISGKSHIFISNYTIIRENARIEAKTEYYGKLYNPELVIGERVTIEQGVHITCSEKVHIGENTTISSYVYISDTEHNHSELNRNTFDVGLKVSPVSIGKCVFIGTGAKIMQGVSIGNNSVIGANAVVTKSIQENCMAVGVPAKIIKKYDVLEHKWKSIKEE